MFRRFTGMLALLLPAALNPQDPNVQNVNVEGVSVQNPNVQNLNAQNQAPAAPPQFHGTYEELTPAQRKLIDDWYAEYDQMTHDNSQPTDYNKFSMSTRTTYEAVTHALISTPLTDKSGKSMGSALELVQSIEAINGKVPRARGDLQFRVYVVLKPDALEKLKASSEFFRDRDNTVYHHGYPLNYRQDGGTPSIQVSVAKDARHADIDVDYRSAKFPAALVNGHLTAANSDVRAGGNTQKHLYRWLGLHDWWHTLLGFPEEVEADSSIMEGEIPPIPRKGEDTVEAAAADYLTAWLVEQKPNLSAAYLSSLSYSCLEEYGPDSGKVVSAGVAPYLAANQMAAVNRVIGKVNTLGDAVEPLSLHDHQLKPVKQRYQTAFALYQVSNGLAAEFVCDPERAFDDFDKVRAEKSASKYGAYFASVFRLKAPKGKGKPDAVTLLWHKEGKYWKVIAWDVEPEEATPGKTPDLRRRRAAAKARPAETQTTDHDFVHASRDFLHSWLVADNFDHAATYFSQRSDNCVLAYLPSDKPAPSTSAEYAAYLRDAITSVGKDVGPVQHLRDAIEPARPDHDDLKVLSHEGEGAYTVVAVPDYLAELFLCEQESSRHPYDVSPDPKRKTYGNYYAVLFSLRTPGEHSAALTLLWAKESEKWKIIAYELLAP